MRRQILSLVFSVTILVIAAAAIADEAPLDETLEEPTGPIVDRIAWTGVKAFAEDELEALLVTTPQPFIQLRFWKPKKRLDDFAVQEDLERIEQAYQDGGYFSATAEVRVRLLENGHAAVEFVVEEGPRVLLEAWTLEVVPNDDDPEPPSPAEIDRLQALIPSERGQPFGASLYRERREQVLQLAAEQGFIKARIRGGAKVDPDAAIAEVAWTLKTGPRHFFGDVDIVGLEGVHEKIVRRELRFATGERFTPSLVDESERRIVSTGLFRSAAIGRSQDKDGAREDDAAKVDLVARVVEAPARSFRASIGYGTEDGPRGEVSLAWRNFGGEGRLFRTRAFGSLLDAGLEASLDQPYVWGETARADLVVTALRQERPGYEAFVAGGSGLLTFYPDRAGPVSIAIGPGFEFAQILAFGIETTEQIRGPRQSFVSNWHTILRHQRVDNLLDPKSGHHLELRNEVGGYPIGSDLDYHRWDLKTRFYQSIGPFVGALRADASTIDPISAGLPAVPLTRRLYAGGTNSVRGFGFQKLGPEDQGNDPIGGLSRLELGAELRIPVYKAIGIVGFVDAGNVTSNPWTFNPRDLRASAGPGLRIATPVGPLRLDFAWLINRPRDTDPWRFHLSVGHAF